MRLIQMAYIDFDPSPGFDHPALALEINGVTVTWVARWAAPQQSGFSTGKIGEKHHQLRARLAFAHPSIEAQCPIEDLPIEDNLPLTPVWLNPPFRKSQLAPTEDEERTPSEAKSFDYFTDVTELVIADLVLQEHPSMNENGLLEIDREALRRIAKSIEDFADIISIAGRRKRTIGSPQPPIALIAENANERSWLDKSKGIADLGFVRISFTQQFNFDITRMPPGSLDDRPDGMKLLADVFSQSWPTGRFRELWRFFERAFSAPTGRLIVPLADFLSQADPRYTRSEIQKWVALRGPVVHGDRREEFALSVDVEPLLSRIEYAAYDVLIFKEQWRSISSLRRSFSDVPGSLKKESGENGPDMGRGEFKIEGRKMVIKVLPVLGVGPLRFMQPEWPISLPGMWAKGPNGVYDDPEDPWNLSYLEDFTQRLRSS